MEQETQCYNDKLGHYTNFWQNTTPMKAN